MLSNDGEGWLDSGGSGLRKHRRPVAMHLLLDLGQSCEVCGDWRLL
jgi:hypothetical protein